MAEVASVLDRLILAVPRINRFGVETSAHAVGASGVSCPQPLRFLCGRIGVGTVCVGGGRYRPLGLGKLLPVGPVLCYLPLDLLCSLVHGYLVLHPEHLFLKSPSLLCIDHHLCGIVIIILCIGTHCHECHHEECHHCLFHFLIPFVRVGHNF